MHDELATTTSDGVRIWIDHVPAIGASRGVVVCLHAMMTDGRYFGARRAGSFAGSIAALGFDVFVADFRGHGHSTPPRAGTDDWSFDDLVDKDLPAIVKACATAANVPIAELILLGHSLGGLVACAALGTAKIPPVRALLLPATAVWLVGPDGSIRRRALMAAYRGVAQLFGRAPVRALGAGTADESVTYVGQLTSWARTARWTSLRGVDYLAALATIETPVVPVVGAGDWMCTVDDARGFAAKIPKARALRIVSTRHGDALDPDHFQLFTRPELRPLWSELLAKLSC